MLSVRCGRFTHALNKRAIERPERPKARHRRYVGYAKVGRAQKPARLGYSQRIYIIGKLDVENVAKKMRNVVFTQMKLLFEHR